MSEGRTVGVGKTLGVAKAVRETETMNHSLWCVTGTPDCPDAGSVLGLLYRRARLSHPPAPILWRVSSVFVCNEAGASSWVLLSWTCSVKLAGKRPIGRGVDGTLGNTGISYPCPPNLITAVPRPPQGAPASLPVQAPPLL